MQSFDGSLGTEGLSVALGVPEAATTWAFADGAVDDGRSERIVVYNPTADRAEADVSVLPTAEEPAPAPQPFHMSIRAGGFGVVDYGAEDRVAAGLGHATVVQSANGVPVVAERVMSHTVADDGGDEEEDEDDGSDEEESVEPAGDIASGPGAIVAADRWSFPSSVDGESARFVVFNPDPEQSTRVTLLDVVDGRESEVAAARDVEVPPGGRVTLAAADGGVEEVDSDEAADGSGGAAGSAWVVESEAPVIVERVLVDADGLRTASGVGIPSADGAVPLARLTGA
jgi:hypothetical protein